ncbi:unnamed protein product [Trichobilharzia regenti]|nr:unnamed protein product [Trichobilharzia regenti]
MFFEKYFQTGSSAVYLCAAGIGSKRDLPPFFFFVLLTIQLVTLGPQILSVLFSHQQMKLPGHPPITVSQVIRNTWNKDGLRGFYRGVSASYFGSLETALNFVIYENFKSELLWREHKRRQKLLLNTTTTTTTSGRVSKFQQSSQPENEYLPQKASDLRGSSGGSKLSASKDMILCMFASACSKAIAITALYPHGKLFLRK